MPRMSKSKQEVWDRLKNGIPVPVDDFMDMNFNVDGTMMYVKNASAGATIFKLSTQYDLRTAVVWP